MWGMLTFKEQKEDTQQAEPWVEACIYVKGEGTRDSSKGKCQEDIRTIQSQRNKKREETQKGSRGPTVLIQERIPRLKTKNKQNRKNEVLGF